MLVEIKLLANRAGVNATLIHDTPFVRHSMSYLRNTAWGPQCHRNDVAVFDYGTRTNVIVDIEGDKDRGKRKWEIQCYSRITILKTCTWTQLWVLDKSASGNLSTLIVFHAISCVILQYCRCGRRTQIFAHPVKKTWGFEPLFGNPVDLP